MRTKIIVGLSGGVDSAVSLLLLKKNKSYDVEALFIKNWDDLLNNFEQCSWAEDYRVAKKVCEQLKVKLHFVSFEEKFFQYVFKPLIEGYQQGFTPNPDILCNRYIKFWIVIMYIKKQFSAEYFATGHYCVLEKIENYKFLHLATDTLKDQTYFLAGTPINNLQKVLFPIGRMSKKEVRTIAERNQLVNYDRRDSTGVCFIGERNFNHFLRQYINPVPGEIIDYQSRKVIGTHLGITFYTIGQRKYLRINYGSCPYYVYQKDIKKRRLFVVTPRTNPLLWSCTINFTKLQIHFPFLFHLIALPCLVRIRHCGKLYPAICFPRSEIIHIINESIYAVAAGQIAVLYWNKICIASSVIAN